MKKLDRQELFSVLNGKLSMIINRYLFGKFKEANLGVTVEQWTVLSCLWEQDKVTQQKLSEITFRDNPSMTRLIDNLEKRDLVVRVPDLTDRRANLIHLTQKGIDLEQRATEIVDCTVDKALDGFSEEEISVCRNVMKKILTNLS